MKRTTKAVIGLASLAAAGYFALFNIFNPCPTSFQEFRSENLKRKYHFSIEEEQMMYAIISSDQARNNPFCGIYQKAKCGYYELKELVTSSTENGCKTESIDSLVAPDQDSQTKYLELSPDSDNAQ